MDIKKINIAFEVLGILFSSGIDEHGIKALKIIDLNRDDIVDIFIYLSIFRENQMVVLQEQIQQNIYNIADNKEGIIKSFEQTITCYN